MENSDKEKRVQGARQLLEAGRFEEALEIYRELVAQSPGEDSLVLALAWACVDSGRTEEAVEHFESLLEKELRNRLFTGFAFDELVRIYRQLGRNDRLIEICEKVAALQKDDLSILTTLGDAYFKTGQHTRAIETFRKIVEMEPDSTAVIVKLGAARVAAGDYDGAEEEFAKAARADTAGSPAYFGRLGRAYMEANQCGRAQAAFRRAIESAPADPMYYCDLGDALICLGEGDAAWDAYEKAAALRPQSAAGFFNRLGNMLARRDDHGQAVSAFRKAIELDPRNTFFYLHLSRSYEALGKEDLAAAAYEKAKTRGAGS